MKYEIVQILTNRATIIINGAEYTITTKGEVFNKHGMALSIRPNTSGYASFTAGSKGVRRRVDIHRLVAELFLPNPNNYSDVDHKDSNRMNASLDNLEWIPHDVNVRRAYERGNHDGRATGEKNCKSKLNKELVMQMRIEYLVQKHTIAFIVRKHGVPWSTVNNVVKGHTWTHIPMPDLSML